MTMGEFRTATVDCPDDMELIIVIRTDKAIVAIRNYEAMFTSEGYDENHDKGASGSYTLYPGKVIS